MLASVTTPFLQIDQGEAKQLADASADLLELYGVPEMAPETIAWASFIQAIGFVYGSRIVAYRNFARMKAAEGRKPADANNSRGSTVNPPPRPDVVQQAPVTMRTVHDPILGDIQVPMSTPVPPQGEP